MPRPLIEAVAAATESGAATLAVLQTGPSTTVLEDAVARSGGRLIADQPVDARALAEAGPGLRAAVGSPST